MDTPTSPPLTIRDRRSRLRFTIESGQRVVLGRDPVQCEILVPLMWVSRRHVAFENVGGRCVVEPLLARQHMYLSGRPGRPLMGKNEFAAGQELATGDLRLVVVETAPGHESPSPGGSGPVWPRTALDPPGHNPLAPVAFAHDWRTDTVVALARELFESRDFSAMPILADALQDAGCDNDVILDHCRGPGPHVRGCWAIDLVLGRQWHRAPN